MICLIKLKNRFINNLIFKPSKDVFGVQDIVLADRYKITENNILTVENSIVETIKLEPKNSTVKKIGTIIMFAGNGENIINTANSEIMEFSKQGFNIILFSYRGYNNSKGKPTLKGAILDSKTVIEYYSNKLDGNIFLYGRSLGGSILLRTLKELKNKSKIKKIIIEGSFLSFRDLAVEMFPFIGKLLMSDKYSANQLDKNCNIPMLIIHSKDDEIIHFKYGKALHRYFINSQLETTSGNHTEYVKKSENRNFINKFMENSP